MNGHEDLPLQVVGGAEQREAIAVPYAELSADALAGVIKSFVLREGTDYGECEVTLEQKMAQVRVRLDRGDAQILFDPVSATVDIVLIPGRWR